MTETLPPRPRRPLRAAILLCEGLLVAGFGAILVRDVLIVHRHMAAVERIESLGGFCGSGESARLAASHRSGLQRIAAWVLGEKPQKSYVEWVDLGRTAKADLSCLPALPEIEVLDLASASVVDEGLRIVPRLRALRRLNLRETPVTEAGLDHLSPSDPQDRVPVLPQLEFLDVGRTAVSNAGMAAIARLSGLRSLFLDGTRVTDVGLLPLADLPNLQTLDVADTVLTDAAIETLSAFGGLKVLTVRGTRITEAGRERLRAALPKCRVQD